MYDDFTPAPLDEQQQTRIPTGWARWSELLVAAALVVIGGIILIQTQDIRIVKSMSQVSPRVIPYGVGTILIALGAWYAIDIVRHPHVISAGEDDEDVDLEAPTDWSVLGFIALALAAFALLMQPAGFIVASAALFTISSTGMGSRKVLLNVGIGLILGAIIYVVFDRWLGVRLPGGITEPLFK